MESSGEPLRIHISNVTKTVLETLGGYFYTERGIIPIKVGCVFYDLTFVFCVLCSVKWGQILLQGKGEMRTYWLNGEDPSRTRRNSEGSQQSEAATITNCSPEIGKLLWTPLLALYNVQS